MVSDLSRSSLPGSKLFGSTLSGHALVAFAAVSLLVVHLAATPGETGAQTFDHLTCYKLKDAKMRGSNGKPPKAQLSLSMLDAPSFPDEAPCEMNVKSKEFCTPSQEVLNGFNGTYNSLIEGNDLSQDFLCYNFKCRTDRDLVTHPTEFSAEDNYAPRSLVKQKIGMQRLCVPAEFSIGGPTTTTLPNRRVFVTTEDYDGAMGGIAGADAECDLLASNAGLGANFIAWLSTTTVDAGNRLGDFRFISTCPGNPPVAENRQQLTDGALDNAILCTETGFAPFSGTDHVWTGTGGDGTEAGFGTCVDWTSNQFGDSSLKGRHTFSDLRWTAALSESCTTRARIYCFEE